MYAAVWPGNTHPKGRALHTGSSLAMPASSSIAKPTVIKRPCSVPDRARPGVPAAPSTPRGECTCLRSTAFHTHFPKRRTCNKASHDDISRCATTQLNGSHRAPHARKCVEKAPLVHFAPVIDVHLSSGPPVGGLGTIIRSVPNEMYYQCEKIHKEQMGVDGPTRKRVRTACEGPLDLLPSTQRKLRREATESAPQPVVRNGAPAAKRA